MIKKSKNKTKEEARDSLKNSASSICEDFLTINEFDLYCHMIDAAIIYLRNCLEDESNERLISYPVIKKSPPLEGEA